MAAKRKETLAMWDRGFHLMSRLRLNPDLAELAPKRLLNNNERTTSRLVASRRGDCMTETEPIGSQ